jgi:lipopolysaccharide export system protein LptC
MVAIACVLSTAACRGGKPGETEEVVPQLKLEGVRFRVYRGEGLRAFGEAASAGLRRDSTEVACRDVVATLPRDPAPVRITAPVGEGVLSDRTFGVSGGVTLTRGDDVVRTERARYASQPGDGGLVTGHDPVTVVGRGYRLEGVGFVLDPSKGDIAMHGGARLVAGGQGAR